MRREVTVPGENMGTVRDLVMTDWFSRLCLGACAHALIVYFAIVFTPALETERSLGIAQCLPFLKCDEKKILISGKLNYITFGPCGAKSVVSNSLVPWPLAKREVPSAQPGQGSSLHCYWFRECRKRDTEVSCALRCEEELFLSIGSSENSSASSRKRS